MEIRKVAKLSERAQELIDDAEKQAKDIITQAEEEAKKIITEAKEEARDAIAKAELREGIERILGDEEEKAKKDAKTTLMSYRSKKESLEKASEKQIENAVKTVVKEVLLL
jgi:vacuolar-type H+-ATPase subunit H